VLGGSAGLWPAILPHLRARAGLKRSELVMRLADALGVADHGAKVERYYHQMEQGLLPAEGVSGRVLDALSGIVGETAQALRDAGRSIGGATGPGTAPPAAFARRARVEAETGVVAASSDRQAEDEWDEVDALFRGG
jgi:hypothetical protein